MSESVHRSVELNKQGIALSGFLSGAISRSFIQPLDVLKIRFQLLPHRCKKDALYSNLLDAIIKIRRHEGLISLWKGHVPAQILSTLYSSIQFLSFNIIRGALNSTQLSWVISRNKIDFISGGLCGMAATIVTQPIDTVRTRFVAQGEPKQYANMRTAIHAICKQGGMRIFYAGLTPALFTIFPSNGVTFSIYYALRNYNLKKRSSVDQNSIHSLNFQFVALVSGSIAGMCGKLTVLPFDLAKKRLQVKNFAAAYTQYGIHYNYTGFFHCLISVVKQEGWQALLKGACPTIIKAGCYSGFIFWSYELCTRLILQIEYFSH